MKPLEHMWPVGWGPSGQNERALETVKYMCNRKKSESAIKTWINAKLRKILFRSLSKLRKIMCNTLNWFWKKLGNYSGPSILKVRAQQCRVTVFYTFSQEAGVLLFYFKPLVRNYYYFYMSDHINAVYSNMYPVAIICASKWVPKDPDKSSKYWRDAK